MSGHRDGDQTGINDLGRQPMAKRSGNWMTIAEFCDELGVARTTFDDWRAKHRGPKCVRLPNGSLRIKRTDFEHWINSLEDAA